MLCLVAVLRLCSVAVLWLCCGCEDMLVAVQNLCFADMSNYS